MTGRSERPSASHVYCLYLDTPFLARGIVTLRSLRRHDPAAALVALALDELSARILRDRFRGELQVIETPALHAADPALAGVRGQRSQWAYYMTLTPPLARFALEACRAKRRAAL